MTPPERVSWTRASVYVQPPLDEAASFPDVRLFVVPDVGGGYPEARLFERPGPALLRALTVESLQWEGRNRLLLSGLDGEAWDALDLGCGC